MLKQLTQLGYKVFALIYSGQIKLQEHIINL